MLSVSRLNGVSVKKHLAQAIYVTVLSQIRIVTEAVSQNKTRLKGKTVFFHILFPSKWLKCLSYGH